MIVLDCSYGLALKSICEVCVHFQNEHNHQVTFKVKGQAYLQDMYSKLVVSFQWVLQDKRNALFNSHSLIKK